jgi:hypothetical protein
MQGRFESIMRSTTRYVAAAGIGFALLSGWWMPVHAGASAAEVKQLVVTTDGRHCPIRLVDPYNARVTENRYVLDNFPDEKVREIGLGQLFLNFTCLNSDDAEGARQYVAARFDNHNGRWKPDFFGYSSDDIALLKPVTHIFRLRATNSSGVGLTQDAVTGDPKTRDRYFGFCLRRPPIMLCGESLAIARPYYNETGLMPYARAILQSIQFIDTRSDDARTSPVRK